MGGRTTFPRVFGGIVLDSFSIVSFFTGLIALLPAGVLMLLGSIGPRSSGVGNAVTVVWGLTVLVFVSRFAQLGIAADVEGGLFSGTAGPWGDTFLAAARLLVLWVAWVLPFVAWALLKGDPQPPAGLPALGFASLVPRVPVLLSIWAGAGMILSFAFVAVAAAAPGFGDLFSPGLWRALFQGRTTELFLAMAGTYGPPIAVFVVVVPVGVAFLALSPKLALTFFVPFFVYAVGMVLTLQGKLCGAFSAASLAEVEGIEPVEAVLPAEASEARPVAAVPVPAAAPAPAPPPARTFGDPRTLHTVWQTRLAAGDAPGAFETAKELIPAGLAKGDAKVASEVFRYHLERLPELELDRAALDTLADQLLRDGDVGAAAWTFSQALDAQPTDAKAFKGLLRVAEHHMEKAKNPIDAVTVYRYLLDRAPASPFADHARDLLADAERKAARPPAPQA